MHVGRLAGHCWRWRAKPSGVELEGGAGRGDMRDGRGNCGWDRVDIEGVDLRDVLFGRAVVAMSWGGQLRVLGVLLLAVVTPRTISEDRCVARLLTLGRVNLFAHPLTYSSGSVVNITVPLRDRAMPFVIGRMSLRQTNQI